MKITFTTSAKSFEKANYILGQAIRMLEENAVSRDIMDLSENDLQAAETFRQQLLKGFEQSSK